MQLSNQFSRSKVGQKTNALHNPPVKVLVDGVVVAGSSAPGDAPPDSTCGDAPCSRAPLPLQAGAHTVQITGGGTPGVEAAATLVGLYGGELVLATDGSWQAYAAPSASSSPPATRSAFGLAQAGAGGLALAVSNASGACGLPQLVLSGGAARFSVSQNSSVLAWAEGGRRLLVGAGALGACNGKLVVDAGSTSWLLLPQGAGGWALCLARNRSSCAAPAADGSVSLGAAAPWLVLESPLVTATLGPLAGWLDGADTSSFALSGDGSVVAWQDTRDAGLWAPRALRASGTSVAYAGFACPVNLWDTAGAAMASQLRDGSPALAWDWALPTTLVLVLSQAQPGALLTLLDAHGSVYELALQGGGRPAVASAVLAGGGCVAAGRAGGASGGSAADGAGGGPHGSLDVGHVGGRGAGAAQHAARGDVLGGPARAGAWRRSRSRRVRARDHNLRSRAVARRRRDHHGAPAPQVGRSAAAARAARSWTQGGAAGVLLASRRSERLRCVSGWRGERGLRGGAADRWGDLCDHVSSRGWVVYIAVFQNLSKRKRFRHIAALYERAVA